MYNVSSCMYLHGMACNAFTHFVSSCNARTCNALRVMHSHEVHFMRVCLHNYVNPRETKAWSETNKFCEGILRYWVILMEQVRFTHTHTHTYTHEMHFVSYMAWNSHMYHALTYTQSAFHVNIFYAHGTCVHYTKCITTRSRMQCVYNFPYMKCTHVPCTLCACCKCISCKD